MTAREVGQYEVARAVEETLWKWLPTHVTRWARRRGVTEQDMSSGVFPIRAEGTSIVSSFSQWAIDQLPHVQVMSGGWVATEGDETGKAGSFEVNVAVLVHGQGEPATQLRRACFEDGIRDVLAKHADLGGIAAGSSLIGGGPAQLSDVDPNEARTLQGSVIVAEFWVPHIFDPFAGPTTPEPLPDVGGVPPIPPDDPQVPEGQDPIVLLAPGEIS